MREMQLWLSGHTSTWRKGVTTSAYTELTAQEEIFFFKKVLRVVLNVSASDLTTFEL